MDPNLFHVDWNQLLEVLAAIPNSTDIWAAARMRIIARSPEVATAGAGDHAHRGRPETREQHQDKERCDAQREARFAWFIVNRHPSSLLGTTHS